MNRKSIILILFSIYFNLLNSGSISFDGPTSAIIINNQNAMFATTQTQFQCFPQNSLLKGTNLQNIKNSFVDNFLTYSITPAPTKINHPINLDGNTLHLYGDSTITSEVTIESSGKFNLDGNTIYLDSDFFIPDNTTLTIISSGIIDGQDNTLTLEKRGQILLDNDVSVTFKNLTFKNKLNTESTPPVKCQNSNSQAIFDNVNFAFTDNFYFTEGQFFINNEVNYTGTSQFIYNSTRPSYIQPNSKFKFNPQTSFSYSPNNTNNNLIVLQNETSCLHLDGSSLKTINTDLQLTKGLLHLDNNATFSANATKELTLTYSQNYGVLVFSVNWSTDGNYLAVGGRDPDSGHDDIEIYSFNGSSLSFTYSQNYGNRVYSVNWSPDGNYLAVGGQDPDSGHDEIEVYYFNGSSLSFTYSQNYGNRVYSVNWSPDGNYLAVGGYSPDSGHDEIEIYSFNGSSLSLTYSQNHGGTAYSVDWSPDGNYLATGGSTLDTGHDKIEIYSFNGLALSLTYSIGNYPGGSIGNPTSVSWSPDGNYLLVSTSPQFSTDHETILYSFNKTYSSLELIHHQAYGNACYSESWSPDGKYIAVGGSDPDNGNEIQIYSFVTTNSSLSLIVSQNYGAAVFSVDWSPDGNYLAVGGNNPDTGHEIQIYSFKSVIGNITFGNSTLGPEYDLDIKVLGGARVSVNYCNLIYDNTGTTSKTFDFVNRSSSLVLDTKSTFSINRNNIKGWHQQSILRQEGHDNSWTISNTTFGYNTGEIKPSGHLLENNSNAIASMYNQIDINSENIRYNSNAILLLENKITNTYFDLLNKITNNSNTIISIDYDLRKQIENNSNAIIKNRENLNINVENIENNSNGIISLDTEYAQFNLDISDNTNNIRYNSNAILELYNDDDLTIYNSNAIVTLDNKLTNTTNYLESLITYNSNAIIHDYEIKDDLQNQIQTNSNNIIYNSNAIINNGETITTIQNQIQTNSNNIIYNSNSIVSLNINTEEATNNSNAIITLKSGLLVTEQNIKENSNAILYTETKLTNTYQDISNQIKYNSNTTIKLQENETELSTNNSNAILLLDNKIKYNSNAIIHSYEIQDLISNEITQNSQDIKENSNAIITIKAENEDLIINNSNFALTLVDEIMYNSNAIIHDYEIKDLLTTATTQNAQEIKENSNAIIHSSETSSLEQRISDNTDNIKYNSDAIISSLDVSGLQAEIDQNVIDIRTNSNALLTIKDDLNESNTAVLQKITNNSNAIIHDYEIKKDIQEQIWNSTNSISQNSSAILNNQNIINNNIDDIKNNSNTILSLNYDFETQINNNSNAIIHTYENLDQIEHNSNAIVSLQTNLLEKIKNNSNAILENKDSIVQTNKEINNNSNAILLLETKLTNTYIELNNKIKYNSNAIVNNYEKMENLYQEIIYNSNAIIHSYKLKDLLATSTTQNAQEIKENSNAILHSFETSSLEQRISDNTDNIKYNSDVIISSLDISELQSEIAQNVIDIRTNRNALLTIKDDLNESNTAVLQKITNNSNAIIHDYEIKKDIQEQIWNSTNSISQNSSAILNNQNIINNNIDDIENNSNAILSLNYDLETQINNNSNAIIYIYENIDQIEHNSNAIISLQPNLLEKIENNSNAILENKDSIVLTNQDVNNNSNAILLLETKLTNTYTELNNEIKYNSNAIICDYKLKITINQDIINNSNAIVELNTGTNPAALQGQIDINKENIENNSNAILYTLDLLGIFPQDITNNSNAIISLEPKIEESKQSTILTKEPITTDIELDQSVFIHPEQIIEIAGNVTIDGKGAIILFGTTNYSQFKVQAGKTVTLKNVQLLRINQKTFDLRYKLIGTQLDDGQIKIGQNVLFGISENITFSQGLIEILNNDQDEAQLFHIKGIEGQKQFKIDPSDKYSNALSFADNNLTWNQRQFGMTSGITSRLPDRFTQNGTVPVLVKCNNNTFGIQNIHINGFKHITKSTSGNYTGALGLLGEADVDIGDDTFTDFEQNKNIQEKYDMVFVTQNLNNSLRILKDDLKFTGQLQFADFGENVLHIDSMLTERIKPKTGAIDPTRRIPQINFATNFVQLTSAFGMGRLIFDNNRIRINNDENGFVAYENSFLGGHTIEITGNPIWDLYDPNSESKEFVLKVDELIGLDDINNQPIISEFYSSLKLWNIKYKRVKTAIDLIYEKELAKLESLKNKVS